METWTEEHWLVSKANTANALGSLFFWETGSTHFFFDSYANLSQPCLIFFLFNNLYKFVLCPYLWFPCFDALVFLYFLLMGMLMRCGFIIIILLGKEFQDLCFILMIWRPEFGRERLPSVLAFSCDYFFVVLFYDLCLWLFF